MESVEGSRDQKEDCIEEGQNSARIFQCIFIRRPRWLRPPLGIGACRLQE